MKFYFRFAVVALMVMVGLVLSGCGSTQKATTTQLTSSEATSSQATVAPQTSVPKEPSKAILTKADKLMKVDKIIRKSKEELEICLHSYKYENGEFKGYLQIKNTTNDPIYTDNYNPLFRNFAVLTVDGQKVEINVSELQRTTGDLEMIFAPKTSRFFQFSTSGLRSKPEKIVMGIGGWDSSTLILSEGEPIELPQVEFNPNKDIAVDLIPILFKLKSDDVFSNYSNITTVLEKASIDSMSFSSSGIELKINITPKKDMKGTDFEPFKKIQFITENGEAIPFTFKSSIGNELIAHKPFEITMRSTGMIRLETTKAKVFIGFQKYTKVGISDEYYLLK